MKIDWTHKKVKIDDIRKVRKFYILSIEGFKSSIFVDQHIFEKRINSYYLRDDYAGNIQREEVLDVEWNIVITQGFFYKTDKVEPPIKIEKDPEKYYISFLEIDGPLGTYVPIK